MITDWFQRWSTYLPEKIAVKDLSLNTSYTYRELDKGGKGLAAWFHGKLNLQKGDRVFIIATFGAEYFMLLSVAQKMGIILVPVNYRLSAPEIAYLIQNSDPSLVIVEKQFETLLTDIPGHIKDIAIYWSVLSEKISQVLEEDTNFSSVVIEESHPCMILYTSGTTGFPKGAIYTHGMMLWNSLNTAMRLKVTSDDRTLMVMPPFHTGGWNVLSTPLLHFGGTVILQSKFDASQALNFLKEEEISIFMAVPTMVKMMMDAEEFNTTDFSSLRYMIVGGEALPIPVIEKWAERGVPIRQGYGLTEAGPNITSLEAEDAIRKRGSIGFPNFYVETKLINEAGTETAANESGELWLRGPMVTPGYWKNVEATKKAFCEGWFKTGDILKKDEDGYLYVVDRIKNMYISGGENVYPAEVEKRLMQHPAVSEAVVVGVPDEKWGESGKAYVVIKPGEKAGEEELLSFCKAGLAKFKVPKYFVFMKELPKNDTGKIDRKKLTALAGPKSA
ncbi:MAG: class I adenylate-forming enzyme family protein [Candidatus Cyclobacteriaceae bacterium M2_1C_046]